MPRKSFEDLIPELLEAASTNAQATNRPLTTCLLEMLCRELPDFAELFAKDVDLASVSHAPTRWVIFSPPPTGPLTQNLVRDYEKLSEIVVDSTNVVGGLHLFEGFADEGQTGHQETTPIVPLNDSQRAAVRGILESKPVTVISGPPGCGKSQVVLSLMLNAWQRGISVLFASNNNQAVDVVRERLQRFESHFPIAIRAGNRRNSNLIQALADTLNFITGKKGSLSNAKEGTTAKRDDLLAKQDALRNFLDSKLPQRVDEAVRSALSAYATFQQTQAELHSIKEELLREFHAFGVNSRPESFFQDVVMPFDGWLAKLSEYQEILRQDDATRERLNVELNIAYETRDRATQRTGLDSSSINSWSWLVSGPGPELLRSWLDRFKELLARPLDQHLAPYEWIADFETWHGEEEARNWATSAKKLASNIRHACGQLSPKLTHVETVKNRYDAQISQVRQLGIPPEIAVNPAVLSGWAEAYALESSLPVAKSDWFPWSKRRRAIRRMKRAERLLRSSFPLTIWRGIGKLISEGRDKLSKIVEQTQIWFSVRSEWEATQSLRNEIEGVLNDLRGRCAELTAHENVPAVTDLEKWQEVARDLTNMAVRADKAALAWQKRMLAEKATIDIRTVTTDFLAIASGVPIKEAWTQGPGDSFREILMRLGSDPSPQSVLEARTAFYTDALTVLIESWERARDAENLSQQLQININSIPTSRRRCDEWKAERPTNLHVELDLPQDRLPEKSDAVFQLYAKYHDWASRWKQFCEQRQPELHKRSQGEYKWAVGTLKEALDLLPSGDQKTTTSKAVQDIVSAGSADWPTTEIQNFFEDYRPDRIKAIINGLEAHIEELSFDLAKQDWLRRMTADSDIQKALDDLHTHYLRNNGRIEETAFPLFRKALEAVPIWITTAQSPQSIPMLPDLYDILVIDEATQCTITNILPLIYRAKRIAVIGDPEQLPAIPNISPAAESALAVKFELNENLLNVIGHAENDLYKASVRCLPGGRHDVIALQEHYRSHPLIIGFSNRHVYQTALKIRTDPAHVASLPFGSSIHGQHISGHCIRGQFNSSWQNPPETEAVCDLVRRLRQSPEARSRSLGIVTPFHAQEEAIKEQLGRLDLLDGVTVGTAHKYQGDERDIMIFSPVVARGIGDGAARWVENPKNLINVAVTRARLALFVVADFDICRIQAGILGDLVKYVDTVEKLRKTSNDELELFSLMIVQGWNPRVHHVERDIEIDFVLTHEGKRLAIEVDGPQHDNTTEQDKARDTFLRGMGYDVLRIPGRAVRETPSLVIKQIGDCTGLPV
ncbi:MAG: AAA domain-containing protein [Thermodesulfovibrionales bacterium]|nr:AAA domain-containing protein [Thermodesulfovibrionales bacterium]